MNMDKVRYPWMVLKFKPEGLEIKGGNVERLPMAALHKMLPQLARFLQIEKGRFILEDRKRKAAAASAAAGASEAAKVNAQPGAAA